MLYSRGESCAKALKISLIRRVERRHLAAITVFDFTNFLLSCKLLNRSTICLFLKILFNQDDHLQPH